jgi:hypothetical protein
MYHRTEPAVIVKNPDEEADLGEGWADRPGGVQGVKAAFTTWCPGLRPEI